MSVGIRFLPACTGSSFRRIRGMRASKRSSCVDEVVRKGSAVPAAALNSLSDSAVWFAACRMVLIGLVLVLPFAVHGKTWVVEYDPGQPENLIGLTAEGAASGDTILVEPGTYYEHIPLDGKSLTIKGLGGPEQTILDGSREFSGREKSIIYTQTGASGSLHVDGLTFQAGGGSPGDAPPGQIGNPQGGAINWWDLEGTASFKASNCRFLWNSAGDDTESTGGAIHLQLMERSQITSCYFEGNEAHHAGGAIFIEGFPGVYSISDCEFVIHRQIIGAGDAVYSPSAEEIILRNNRFVSHETGQGLTLALGAIRTTVVGNTFEDHGGRQATWMRFGEGLGPPGAAHYDFVFKDNFLWRDSEPPAENETAIRMNWSRCTVEFSGNTLVNLSLVWSTNSGSISCKNNIFYKTRTWLGSGGGEIKCNDAWPDTIITSSYSNYAMEGNLSADPLFCDEGIGDFRLAWESPCADANAPAGCGQIGLFESACRQTAVRQTTWGRLKLQFQKDRR